MFIVCGNEILFFLRKSENFKKDLGKTLFIRDPVTGSMKKNNNKEIEIYGIETGRPIFKEGVYLDRYNVYNDYKIVDNTIFFYEKNEKWEGEAFDEEKIIEFINKINKKINNK